MLIPIRKFCNFGIMFFTPDFEKFLFRFFWIGIGIYMKFWFSIRFYFYKIPITLVISISLCILYFRWTKNWNFIITSISIQNSPILEMLFPFQFPKLRFSNFCNEIGMKILILILLKKKKNNKEILKTLIPIRSIQFSPMIPIVSL